ncbi:MAG: STT3 domain-containing protein [Candidatus Bathyarchaeia archaeon]
MKRNSYSESLFNKVKNSIKGLKVSGSSYLHFIVLSLILFLAAIIRLLPLRWGFFISEFDPYQQYRMAEYIVNNGFKAWFNWHDSMSWYPWGRNIPTTSFPGVAFTAALLYMLLQDLGVSVTLYQLCVIFPVIMGVATCLAAYLLGREWNKSVGLLSALFLAFSTSHITRTSLGFFDDETIGIFTMLLFFMFYLKALSNSKPLRISIIYALLAGLSLSYIGMSWGALRYPASLIALFTLVLVFIKRYTTRLLIVYSITYGTFFLTILQLPKLGYSFITEWSTLALILILIILVLYEIFNRVKSFYGKLFVLLGFIACLIAGTYILWSQGLIAPLAGKFAAIVNPLTRAEMPLVESVAEHRPGTWSSFFYEFGALLILGLFGFFFSLQKRGINDIFLILFGLSSIYFAGSFVRLTIILTPALSLLSSIGIIELAKPSLDILREKIIFPKKKIKFESRVTREFGVAILLVLLIVITPTLYYASSSAYAPTTIAVSSIPTAPTGESASKYQDWLQALIWMRENLPNNAVVFSWWDYGYWITTIADKRSMADNGTLNFTQIALIARTFLSNETEAIPTLKSYNVTHIAIFVTWTRGQSGVQYYGYGEDNKWYWMARIGNGTSYDGKTVYFYEKRENQQVKYYRVITSNNQVIANETIAERTGINENTILGKLIAIGINPSQASSDYFKLVYASQPNRFVFIYEVSYPALSELTLSLSKSDILYGETIILHGRLTSKNEGLSDKLITLEYSKDGGLTWEKIGTSLTTVNGSYIYNWIPGSGVYLIRSRWDGEAGKYTKAFSQTLPLTVSNASLSLNVSLSPSQLKLGENVRIEVSSLIYKEGNITVQYSADKINWFNLTEGKLEQNMFKTTWKPEKPGTYYIKVLLITKEGTSLSSEIKTLIVEST